MDYVNKMWFLLSHVLPLLTVRPKTGFQLWLEENRKSITAIHPDLQETDIIKEAMGRFRTLSAEERLVGGAMKGVGRGTRGEKYLRALRKMTRTLVNPCRNFWTYKLKLYEKGKTEAEGLSSTFLASWGTTEEESLFTIASSYKNKRKRQTTTI